MKGIYWRPSGVPRSVLAVIAILAVAALLSVELFKVKKIKPYHAEKLQSALAMKKGMEVIKNYRIQRIGPLDRDFDPSESGIIGLQDSPITSGAGHLEAKQTSANPNWAAVMVDMIKRAGLKEGDVIAMGVSGSFPALNLAAVVAAEKLKLIVVPISSITASNWGANIPQLTWLDMERILLGAGVISSRSVAASLGGKEDTALARTERGRRMLQSAIERNGVRILSSDNTNENINARMAVYREFAKGKPIKAYINTGGGTISVGTTVGKKRFQPGLNRKHSAVALKIDSVMSRFGRDGVPLIHMTQIIRLAQKYGLTTSPSKMPTVGEGPIFLSREYNRVLAAVCILILFGILYIFIKSDIGFRIFGSGKVTKTPKHPEPMV